MPAVDAGVCGCGCCGASPLQLLRGVQSHNSWMHRFLESLDIGYLDRHSQCLYLAAAAAAAVSGKILQKIPRSCFRKLWEHEMRNEKRKLGGDWMAAVV